MQRSERTTTMCIQTTMKSHKSAKSENTNILLQQRSLDYLCWTIKRQDKADDEWQEFSQPCVKLLVKKAVVV